jgi:hypothetical protein
MAFICNNQPTQLKVLEQFIINITRELNTTRQLLLQEVIPKTLGGAGKDKFFDSSENDIMEGRSDAN